MPLPERFLRCTALVLLLLVVGLSGCQPVTSTTGKAREVVIPKDGPPPPPPPPGFTRNSRTETRQGKTKVMKPVREEEPARASRYESVYEPAPKR
jgi:hypothetical protein